MSWLQERTECSDVWWTALVQSLISKHSHPSDDPNHDTTDERLWLKELVDLICDTAPPQGTTFPYDENMRAAAIMAHVLHLWYCRVQFAKTQDPNRPVSLRRTAYVRWLQYIQSMAMVPVDARDDATHFPGQRWQSPFDPHSESGTFV